MKKLATIGMPLALLLGALAAGAIIILTPQTPTNGICQQGTKVCVWKDVRVPKDQFLIVEGKNITISTSGEQPMESRSALVIRGGDETYTVSVTSGDWRFASIQEVDQTECAFMKAAGSDYCFLTPTPGLAVTPVP